MSLREAVDVVGKALDVVGVAAIVLGIAYATVVAARRRAAPDGRFRLYRRSVGRAILLGLELLIAADIVRTVAVEPGFESVGVLAAIVLVRTFLSFTLELELEGRWPWEHAPPAGPRREG